MTIKNVIIYAQKLPPEYIGGMETNAYNLIKRLAAGNEFNLSVITQSKKRNLFTKKIVLPYPGVRVEAVLVKKKKLRKSFVKVLDKMGFRSEETLVFHNTLDMHQHFKTIKEAGYYQIARSGGNDIFFLQKSEGRSRTFLADLLCLDKFLVNSEYSFARSIEVGVAGTHMEIVKGGCDTEVPVLVDRQALGLPQDKLIILMCGRLVDFKGIEDAIEALKRLDEKKIDFFFAVVGEGELRSNLEQQILIAGLQKKCKFFGKIEPDNVHAFYAASDIFLSASKGIMREVDGYRYLHTETMGRSICEAQASGLPVVATNAGGAAEMLRDQETGLVVQEGNVAEIEAALSLLLQDYELRKRYSVNAVKYAKSELSWDEVFGRYIGVIKALDQ